ncbi:MAG: choice-of-anchor tandem repeat GloVer-containing protein, partial [Acidimicrobiales bacterium]
MAGLIAAPGGTIYGTTQLGGASGLGTVFPLKPPVASGPWTQRVLYSFVGGLDGEQPVAGLLASHNGTLYGTTKLGGASSSGTVFALTPPSSPGGAWTESVLYSFTGGSDGGTPVAGLIFGPSGGTLYG